jgi:3-oxoacyl-[acyl-carrier-protein] synthase II
MMNISGIGLIFTRGRGIETYTNALREGWMLPSPPSDPQFIIPAYRVAQETIADKSLLRKFRRADRFSKMAVLAARDAVQDSGISYESGTSSLGLIISTAFGPHVTTFRFLDDILDYGDANVSPTIFSHSVHNAAAAYTALALETQGPALTVTQFDFSFHQAVILAQTWLNQGRCEYVLVGAVDECGPAMEYICSQCLNIPQDGKIHPFDFSDSPATVPGEGAVFFLMSREKSLKKYCELSDSSVYHNMIRQAHKPDILLLDADGMAENETGYRKVADSKILTAGYSPIFGSMMTGSAFHCAAAALMLKNQIRYACPVQDNPRGLNLCTATEPAEIQNIWCIRQNCFGDTGIIKLRREA